MEQALHQTVLLNQAVEALAVKSDGHYIDATFGRGGHSRLILERLGPDGTLTVVDCDPEAIEFAKRLQQADPRVSVEVGFFETVMQDLLEEGAHFDGVLFDFGVSSPQLDQAERGFSFQQDGPLDMRMNNAAGLSAAQWLNSATADEMKRVFWRYAEEKNAGRIARKIVEAREEKPLATTFDLVDVVKTVNKPNYKIKKHPATRVFQAVRIFINDELGQVERVLPVALKLLNKSGRLVVISFHSLEDRLVKRFMRDASQPPKVDRRMPVIPDDAKQPELKLITKPIKAVDHDENVRARSAIMRVAEKL
ncbi:16S rRNA (cytosine(1402)-N(4))-methyltransferase RsmH [Marinicella sp. S1101]|uniref:16S rRNA (cytosine(1402)-N(4))-methyltransferase RsmH n=1 Tax=Marinicella marina TaxID=2996016 RepID=UPI002260E0AC|nr:16S rRNA (cytosine(1402)-N(4))-methyltransferase RsmH [Marinicella marina]MCX7553876.1 16S rRNA (cytosine(1402)-N(4))-methyltransferase RsmH [Marinicella marina]MDJ1140368.1 16S rRNA (cytosine(1402)-N(4))-methyltransferase RsmH [Marinicella marina]